MSQRRQLFHSLDVVFLLVVSLLVISARTTTIVAAASAPSSPKCLYYVLGVPKTASEDEIKKGYRKQALKHHPDKGGNVEDFKATTRAYDILSDETKRRMYDQYGEAAFEDGSAPDEQQQARSSTSSSQKTSIRPLRCSLEDLATGATKKLKVSFGGVSRIYEVPLTKGWKQGTKITYKATRGFPPITFVIEEKEHDFFIRVGNDLVHIQDLQDIEHSNQLFPEDDTIDYQFDLPTGETWKKALPLTSPCLCHGQSLTIPDKGMPIKGGPQRGALRIFFFDFIKHPDPHLIWRRIVRQCSP